MKIALIHYRMIYKGGLETRLLNYIHYFLSQGHEVTVICSKIKPGIVAGHENLKIKKLNLGFMPKLFRKWYFDVRLKKEMEKNHYDFSLSLGRTSHQDTVLAPSNHLGFLKAQHRVPSSISDRLQIYLDRQSYQKSKIIYAASQMMKDELADLYQIDPDKIKILYPPLNVSVFKRNLKEKKKFFREKYNIKPDALCFLFVSTSNKRKGIELLAKVFKRLDNSMYHLYVAGDNPKISDQKNIHYLGFQNHVEELFAAADFTIHPAIYEPFGQVISESLQCGTPVIISENTGAKELVQQAYGVVVKGFDADNWLEVIQHIQEQTFTIPEDFADRHHLSTEAHVQKMLAYFQSM